MSHAVIPVLQKVTFVLSLVMITIFMVTPAWAGPLPGPGDPSLVEKEKQDYHHLISLVMNRDDPIPICPWTGKPYVLETKNGQTIIPWPDPAGRYLTRPRYLVTGQGAFFRQDLPGLRLAPGFSADLNGWLTLTGKPDRVLVLDEEKRPVFEFPKSGGRLIIAGSPDSPGEEIVNIMAALPVKHPEKTGRAFFRIIYAADNRVQTRDLFELNSEYLKPLALINQALFPPTSPLPRVSLAPLKSPRP